MVICFACRSIYHAHFPLITVQPCSVPGNKISDAVQIYTTACSGPDQIKHQSYASLAFVMGIPRWPVNSPQRGPVTWDKSPFHDVIMVNRHWWNFFEDETKYVIDSVFLSFSYQFFSAWHMKVVPTFLSKITWNAIQKVLISNKQQTQVISVIYKT